MASAFARLKSSLCLLLQIALVNILIEGQTLRSTLPSLTDQIGLQLTK